MKIAHRFIGGVRRGYETAVREADGWASKVYWMSSYQSSASRTVFTLLVPLKRWAIFIQSASRTELILLLQLSCGIAKSQARHRGL